MFPAYRRLAGARHLYRISAHDRFEELQRVGQRWVLYHVDARAYPERVRVLEMLEAAAPFEELPELEWHRAYTEASSDTASIP